jgi:hypothetical protein
MNFKVFSVALVVLLAALFRVLPHPANFTPIVAMALFGGAKFEKKWMAIAIVLGSMLLSDLIIGFHPLQLVIYLTLTGIALFAKTLSNKLSVINVGLGAFFASLFFFVVTNFGEWALGLLYPRTIEGLVMCFTAAIPFFQQSLAGDLFYTALIFGLSAVVERSVASMQASRQVA